MTARWALMLGQVPRRLAVVMPVLARQARTQEEL
jgi:hypothetical protein